MQSDNIYNSANPKDKPCAFNSTTSFADTAHEVTFDERQAALDARQAMMERYRQALKECC